MDAEIFIDSEKYISSSRAAEKTGYNQDYIGQLCRKKKVHAKLMGRTWFVCEVGLLKHLKEQQIKKGLLEKTVAEEKKVPEVKPEAKVESFWVAKINFQLPLKNELTAKMSFLAIAVMALIVSAQAFLFWSVAPEQVSRVAVAFGQEINNQVIETKTLASGIVETITIPVVATSSLAHQTLTLATNIFGGTMTHVKNSFTVTARVGEAISENTSSSSTSFIHSIGRKIITSSRVVMKVPKTLLNTLSAIPGVVLSVTEKSFEISSTNISYITAHAVGIVLGGLGDLAYKNYSGMQLAFSHIDQTTKINIVIGKNIYRSLSDLPIVFSKTFRQSLFVGNFVLETTTDGLTDLTLRTTNPFKIIGKTLASATLNISESSVASVRFGFDRSSELQKDFDISWFKFGDDISGGTQLISSQITQVSNAVTQPVMNALGSLADYSYKKALAIFYTPEHVATTGREIAQRFSRDGHDAMLGAAGTIDGSQIDLVASLQSVVTGALNIESVVSDGLVSIFTWTSGNLLAGWDTLHRSFLALIRETTLLATNLFPASKPVVPNSTSVPTVDSKQDGFVVVPKGTEASVGETVQRIKDSFSDEVHVTESPDGTSGVITPVFKSGTGQDYIYVLVPVKKDENNK